MAKSLDKSLQNIENKLGSSEIPPAELEDKLGWHLDKIESLIGGGSGGKAEWGAIEGTLSDQEDLQTALDKKQSKLVSGENIKTINNESILGEGNINISGGQKLYRHHINSV